MSLYNQELLDILGEETRKALPEILKGSSLNWERTYSGSYTAQAGDVKLRASFIQTYLGPQFYGIRASGKGWEQMFDSLEHASEALGVTL